MRKAPSKRLNRTTKWKPRGNLIDLHHPNINLNRTMDIQHKKPDKESEEMNCAGCNHRVFGRGCLLTEKRVTDHEHCEKWEPIKNESIHDQSAIEQYRQHGLILDLGA